MCVTVSDLHLCPIYGKKLVEKIVYKLNSIKDLSFIVLTGVDSDGKIIVNDSNSKKNSNKTWKIEDLMSQIRDLWVYQ